MTLDKIRTVALVLALLAAIASPFADIPNLALILLVLGAVAGWDAPQDRRLGTMIAALVLIQLSGELGAIPAAGDQLATIFGSIGVAAVGSSIIGICQTLASRIKF